MRSLTPLFAVLALILFPFLNASAQVGIGTSSPSPNAVLELRSPGNNQGFLVPRLTTAERTAPAFTNALTSSEAGLLVFDTDTGKFYYWSGSGWIVIEDSTGTDSQTLGFASPNLTISGGNSVNLSAINTDGQTLTYTPGTGLLAISGGNSVTITGTLPGGAAGGDLTGTYPGPTIATGAGNNIVTAVNNASTTGTINTNRLNTSVVLDTESPAAGDVGGSYSGGLQLNANAVTTVEILDGTVASADITDATIVTADLANLAVTDTKIGTGITVSKLTASATAGQVLTTVGTTTAWAALPDASATNEIQDLSLTSNTLSLSGDATTVNLAPYLDNTDNQDLSLTGNTLSLTNDGTTVNLAGYLDNTDAQILSFTSPNLSISGGNSINLSALNTDNQDLSLTGNTLSLTNDGTTVSLAGYLDNTDNQDLTLTGNTLSLTNDGTTVSLAAYLDNTDAQNLSLGTRTGTLQPVNISGGTSITIDVADNDNSVTNEIQDLSLAGNTLSLSSDATTVSLAAYLDNTDNQDLTLTGNTLSLTNDATTINLAPYLDNTDAQNLSLGTRTGTLQPINISGGTSITIDVADNDNSPTNEIQNLSSTAVGTQRTINISGGTGTTIDVADGDSSPTNEIQDIASVLTTGNDAKTLAAVNFSAISINTTATPGALNVDGSHFRSFIVLPSGTDTYDVKPSDYIIIGRSTVSKPYNVILPKASDNRGRILIIRATGTGASDGIQVVSTESIDGSGTLPIMFIEGTNTVYSVTVMSDGKEWYTISKSRY